MTAEYSQHGDVAVITVRNPPVNALSAAMRTGIRDGVARAEADPAIVGTVIIGDPGFIAGADIREFGKLPVRPGLRDLFPPIEAAGKPVVAAIAGNALGGGLELALACHLQDCRKGCAARIAGSQSGAVARWWRHGAAAAPDGRGGGAGSDAGRQARQCRARAGSWYS